MRSIRSTTTLALVALLIGCGGSDGGTTDPNANTNTGGGKTMTATYNGTDFRPTILTSAYNAGQVGFSATDGTRSLIVAGVNVNATGSYSLAQGNANTLVGTWIDATGTYATGFANAGGTVTFTVLQLGRVAGSFNLSMRNSATSSTATVALVGSFDIKFP